MDDCGRINIFLTFIYSLTFAGHLLQPTDTVTLITYCAQNDLENLVHYAINKSINHLYKVYRWWPIDYLNFQCLVLEMACFRLNKT